MSPEPSPIRLSAFRLALKRVFDLVCALVGLIVLLPVLFVTAAAVKLTSRGPVFYRQERVGRGFRPFKIVKFRTMIVNADRLGAQITAGRDPRITRVGAVLRKTKLDELPQLWNVLVGEMSLVGPRPEVPRYVELFHADYDTLLRVRPGITDLASVEFRDEADLLGAAADPEQEYIQNVLPRKIALSREYLQRLSLLEDLRILGRTFLRILR